jgi:hypothetical protein
MRINSWTSPSASRSGGGGASLSAQCCAEIRSSPTPGGVAPQLSYGGRYRAAQPPLLESYREAWSFSTNVAAQPAEPKLLKRSLQDDRVVKSSSMAPQSSPAIAISPAHDCIWNASNSGQSASNACRSTRPAQSATSTLESEPTRKYSVNSLLFSNSSKRTSPLAAIRNPRAE